MEELPHGAFWFAIHVIPAASIMLTVRRFLKIPDELRLKILRCILLGTYFHCLFGFSTWWISASFAAGLIVIIYPIPGIYLHLFRSCAIIVPNEWEVSVCSKIK